MCDRSFRFYWFITCEEAPREGLCGACHTTKPWYTLSLPPNRAQLIFFLFKLLYIYLCFIKSSVFESEPISNFIEHKWEWIENAGDESNYKVGLLKGLPGADTRLFLFEADIYDPDLFRPAIKGCEFIFLVATPLKHDPLNSKVTLLLPFF